MFVDGTYFAVVAMNSGVPQESILWLLLFLCYVNVTCFMLYIVA